MAPTKPLERPTAVSVICIIRWIFSGLLLTLALGMQFISFLNVDNGGYGGILFIIGIVLMVFSLISITITYYLWKLKNWARIVVLIFSIIGLLSIPIGTVVGIFVIYFLALDEKTRQVFQ